MKSKMLSIVLVVLGLCFAPVAAWAQDSNNTIDISVTRTGDVTFTNWSYIHGSSLYNVTGNVNVIGSATLPNSASFELIADPGVTVTWQAELTGATGNGVGLMELGLNGAGFANFVLDTGGRITQNGSGGAPIPGVAISATPFNVTVNGGEINCTDAADAIYAGTVVINDGAVTANEGVAINSNSVTVTGGTVSSAKSYAIDGSGGSGGDVIVSGGTVKTDSDMAIYAPGGRVTVSGGTVESTSITSFNGTIVAPNMGPSPGTVTISGAGAVISASGVAIDSDDVTVTGGSVSVGRGGTAIGVGAGKALISGGEIRATGADGTGIRGGANSRIEITGGEVRAGERGVVGASVRGDAIFSEGILVTVTGGAIIAEGFDSKAIGSPVPTAAPFDAHSDIVIRVTGGTVSCIAGETPAGLAECMAFSTNGVAAFLTGTAREGSYHSGDYFGMIVEVGRLNVPLLFAGTTNELTPWTFSGTPSFSWENPLTQGNPALIETSRTSGVTTLIRSIDWGTVVGDAPVITSANSTTVRYATPSTFQVTATGVPTMAYNLSGASIPSGVTIDGASGVITIAETVGIGMYTFDITATNGSGSDSQAFTLNVETEVILSAAIGVTAPVRGATMNTAVVTCGANFSCGTVNWNPPHNPFEGGRQYTASVTLTANTGYTFTGGLTGATTINGNNATVTNNTGNTVTLSYQFPATAATPIANAAITVT
ncbi:MAG: hypothetical protein FWC38_09620, partial [Proteobacteria bacterium]|nr:hypothetical protein [Pseudomonadota bacterium]